MALDPQLRTVLERMEAADPTPITGGSAAEARDHYRALAMARRSGDYRPEAVARVSDDQAYGPRGPVPVRVYWPAVDSSAEDGEAGAQPVVTYLHGGGWVVGDLDTHDPVCRRLANAVEAIVVSVGYRLAPEHPHPAPLDDAMAALAWTAAQFPDRPHGVAGDSAGASLAAGAARRVAERRDGAPRVNLAAQFLAYPATDPTMGFPSVQANGEGYFLTAADMAWFYRQYLPAAEVGTDPDVDLLRASVPEGLAPAIIVTAEYDPLHDEGVAYADRLRDAGVAVEHIEGVGLIHGFLAFLGVADAAERCGATALGALADLLRAGDR